MAISSFFCQLQNDKNIQVFFYMQTSFAVIRYYTFFLLKNKSRLAAGLMNIFFRHKPIQVVVNVQPLSS